MEPRDRLYQHLLEDYRYVRWVTGQAPDDSGYWYDWAVDDPIRKEVMEQARLTILAIQGTPVSMTESEIADRVQQALRRAKEQEVFIGKKVGRVRYLGRYNWVAAAAVLLVLGLGWFTYSQYDSPAVSRLAGQTPAPTAPLQPLDQFQVVVNTNKPVRHVLLPDGSSVVLRKNSQLRYANVFRGNKRDVYLSGEAFFEVTKDAKRPFLVYANGLVTKVLGTSFNVRAHQKAEQVIVVVRTGKVAVFAQTDVRAEALENNRELTGLVLMPNQQATFERTDARLTRTEVAAPVEQPSFTYNATPIAEVFASLEKAYGITIAFDRDIMAHCSLSATLGDEPLQKKVQWICSILEATYQVKGEQIIITGKPCQ